jgi:hypothetical protein
MSENYTVTIRSLSGVESEVSFSLPQAISAMQAWEKAKGGDQRVNSIQLVIWLQETGNQLTMVSIIEMVKELDKLKSN